MDDAPVVDLVSYDIDKLQNYQIFYPQYNLAKVLQKMEKIRLLNKAQ